MDPESVPEEMLFGSSSQFQNDEDWDGSDDDILNAIYSDNDDLLLCSTSQELIDDFSILTSDSSGECNEPGSAVPGRYCLTVSRAFIPNLDQGKCHCED